MGRELVQTQCLGTRLFRKGATWGLRRVLHVERGAEQRNVHVHIGAIWEVKGELCVCMYV